jgi:hypothetical protein
MPLPPASPLRALPAILLLAAALLPAARPAAAQAPFTLTIIHTNDVHDRVDPVSAFNNTCSAKDRAKKRCYGGYSRLMTLIHALRKSATNPVVLSGGDQFQGSLFYRTYKGRLAARAMNLIGYDAAAVGNHRCDQYRRFARAASEGAHQALRGAARGRQEDRHRRLHHRGHAGAFQARPSGAFQARRRCVARRHRAAEGAGRRQDRRRQPCRFLT